MDKQNIDIKKIETLLNRDLNKRYLDNEYTYKDIVLELDIIALLNIQDEEEFSEYIFNRFFLNNEKAFECRVRKLGSRIIVIYREGI